MHRQMRAIRERAGLTREELSRRSGVTATTIYNWERGTLGQTLENITAVCDALGISIDEYIGHKPRGARTPLEKELCEMNKNITMLAALCESLRGEKK